MEMERVGTNRPTTNARAEISQLRAENIALTTRVDELEKTMKAILQFITELELDQGEEYMPAGEYYGTKFE